MAYAATAGVSLPSMTAAPGVLALQRAMVWLVGASGAIVFIEPSPYELATLAASLIFFATGLRMRLVFVPLLLLAVPDQYRLQHQCGRGDGPAQCSELDRDLVVHGGHGHLLRDGHLRGHRGAASTCSAAALSSAP